MKNLLLIISLLFSFTVFSQIEKVVPSRPNPPKLVNDFGGKLTSEQRETLEEKLDQYDKSTSNQIAIVILPGITDQGGTEYPIEEVGLKIIRDWGVGSKKNNNGVVIVVALTERKIRIETGYGLEGAIPDVTAKAIIENDLKPAFREENYYRGFDNAINSIMKAAEGEYKAPPGYGKKGKGGAGFGKLIIAVIVLFIILSMFGGGGRGGGYMSRRGYRGWTGPVIFPGGWGGSSGGGGWSGGGGGFGGGGFGGFGGGGGGGGGASGSW